MSDTAIIFGFLSLAALAVALFAVIRGGRPAAEAARRLAEMEERLQTRLDALGRGWQSSSSQQMNQLAGRLEELHRATGQVIALSGSIEQLNRALATPKGRGAFGELSLSQLLKDLLPPEYYCEQWTVEGGTRVDAAILLREGALPIDAKFTLVPGGAEDSPEVAREFARAVEARGREIAQKYIRPPRTLEFAFMFVPAESVFCRIILDRELHQKLLGMRVVPTSPNSLYAYFQALAIGLRGVKIEEKAREIEHLLAALRIDFIRFGEHFRKVGSHLDNARTQFSSAERDVSRFGDRLDSLRLGAGEKPSDPAAPPPPEAAS